VDLLVLGHAGGVEQVFVDGTGAFVVQFAVGDGDTVDLGLEEGAEHGVKVLSLEYNGMNRLASADWHRGNVA
jgi:hypothetical protein